MTPLHAGELEELRSQVINDGADHRIKICNLVMKLEIAAGKRSDADAVGRLHTAIGHQVGASGCERPDQLLQRHATKLVA